MKQKIIFCILIIMCFLLSGCNNFKKIFLEEKYYKDSKIIDMNYKMFKEVSTTNENFGILIYQPMCAASSDFEKVIRDFSKDNKISFYKLTYSDMKKTSLKNKVKYYPSFVIYSKGKIIDYLDASKDSDIDYYTSVNGFKKWFSTYVELIDAKEFNN